MNISTRLALASEKPALWQLYESAMRPHIEAIWGWDRGWQAADFDTAFAASSTCVVEVDGDLAGYVQLDAGEPEDYLRMLVLAPGYRSSGIGAVLLANLVGAARQGGRGLYLRVFRTNPAAQRFYEREGWCVAADEGDFFLMRQSACPGASPGLPRHGRSA
jgi:GNAT superfamily N-acetyltransferase